jgi:hypothetical protein
MSDDPTATQDGTTDANIEGVRHRRHLRRTRFIMLAVAVIVISATVAWHFLLPSSTGGMPGGLSERDKKEIAALLRGFTVGHGFQALRRGEFRQCLRSLKISRQQRINRFIDDHDGTFRVYTVVDSPKDTDGWYAWSRHVMSKTNDQWVILRSY